MSNLCRNTMTITTPTRVYFTTGNIKGYGYIYNKKSVKELSATFLRLIDRRDDPSLGILTKLNFTGDDEDSFIDTRVLLGPRYKWSPKEKQQLRRHKK